MKRMKYDDIYLCHCLDGLCQLETGSIDLMETDPPYRWAVSDGWVYQETVELPPDREARQADELPHTDRIAERRRGARPVHWLGHDSSCVLGNNRHYIGFEINEDYYNIAKARLRPVKAQRKLTRFFK
jgi:DNA modification methylase